MEERALTPGLIAWDEENGYWDVSRDIERELEQRLMDDAVYAWVLDVNVRDGSEAIVCFYDAGKGTACYCLIDGIAYGADDEPVVPDSSTFVEVETSWVATAMGGGDEDEGMRSLEARNLAEITKRQLPELAAGEPAAAAPDADADEAEAERDATEAETPEAETEDRENGVLGPDGIEPAPEDEINDTEADEEGHAPTTNETEDDQLTGGEPAAGERTAEDEVAELQYHVRTRLALGGDDESSLRGDSARWMGIRT